MNEGEGKQEARRKFVSDLLVLLGAQFFLGSTTG